MPKPADLPVIDERVAKAKQRGADYVSVRQLSELVGATTLLRLRGALLPPG